MLMQGSIPANPQIDKVHIFLNYFQEHTKSNPPKSYKKQIIRINSQPKQQATYSHKMSTIIFFYQDSM